MFVERKKWNEVERVVKVVAEERRVIPDRGNIYAVDDRPLAINKPMYTIRIDFMADGLSKDTIVKYGVEMFPALAKLFPEKSAEQYKQLFLNSWNLSRREIEHNKTVKSGGRKQSKSRGVRIVSRDINYLELQQLKAITYFKKKGGGLIAEERISREYPFGAIARRTIGSLQIANDTLLLDGTKLKVNKWAKGSSGLELRFDSILRGESGLKSVHRIAKKSVDVIELPSIQGLDIKTTIDVDIQDIAEKSLYAKLMDTGAESGFAIIMEVETGEIKGISNLDRMPGGRYAELKPHVFSYMADPGSTFKTISMMVALEDGVVTPQDTFCLGTGRYPYSRGAIADHNYRGERDKDGKKIDMGCITVAQGMHTSSNIVVARTILRGYEKHPEKFIEKIYDMGLTKDLIWDVPLKGMEGRSLIKHPVKNKNDRRSPWSALSLPWIAHGYETQIAPIYLLMFYNGIANGGKMIKPFLVKEFLKNGKVEKEIKPEVINSKLCSERTLKEIQDMLVGVVNEGTAKMVRSDYFQIAGKTGTAQLNINGVYRRDAHYVSFCGYFPADKPKYTCLVGIVRPKEPASSGGTAGIVFKNIAEGVYSRNVLLAPNELKLNPDVSKVPYVKGGSYKKTKNVLTNLGLTFDDVSANGQWIKESGHKDKVQLQANELTGELVPDVKGMGARDALFLLESLGLRVDLKGSGRVVRQSVNGGSRIVKGMRIEIVLE